MNIGFDAKRYFHNSTGLGNYSRDLVDTLILQYPNNRYYLFDNNPSTLHLPSNTIAAVPRNNSAIWRTFGILKDVGLHKIDLFHGLSNELPFGTWPKNTRKVVTIHDVIFRIFPSHYSMIDRSIYDFKTKHAIKTADRIVATSMATANDLMVSYGAKQEKIQVIYQTCGEAHWRIYPSDILNGFRMNKRLPDSFILYVSSFQIRKNHLQLLKALKQSGQKNIRLVLAGRKGETSILCNEYIEQNGLGNQVWILNDLQNSDLPLLYRCASAFIYPSLVEGFGIPLIEAACAGLPMAVNSIPVFNELAPLNSLKFDAGNEESISSVLVHLNGLSKTEYFDFLEPFKSVNVAEKMNTLYTGCVQ